MTQPTHEASVGVLRARRRSPRALLRERGILTLQELAEAIVTDKTVRASASKKLMPAARAVVKRAARGSVTLDKTSKAVLEKTCILHISSEHTASGAHATLARSWESWASRETKRAAAKLSMDEALAILELRHTHFARAIRAYAV